MSKIKTVSVALKDIRSNPFRQEDTAKRLRKRLRRLSSQSETLVLENMIGRRVDGVVQIAYSHHRLARLRMFLAPTIASQSTLTSER